MRHWALVPGSVVGVLLVSSIMGLSSTSTAFAVSGQVGPPSPNVPAIGVATSENQFISEAYQFASTNGSQFTVTVATPYVSKSDRASGAFMALESRNGRQAVIVGWYVDPQFFHDTSTHLFIKREVNGVWCTKNCGYIASKTKIREGVKLSDKPRQFEIEQRHGAWWIGSNKRWIGRYPDSVWNKKFVKAGATAWYGQVTTPSVTPCSDMGNGQWASSASAAVISDISFFNGTKTNFRTTSTKPAFYSIHTVSSSSFRFGGGGAC